MALLVPVACMSSAASSDAAASLCGPYLHVRQNLPVTPPAVNAAMDYASETIFGDVPDLVIKDWTRTDHTDNLIEFIVTLRTGDGSQEFSFWMAEGKGREDTPLHIVVHQTGLPLCAVFRDATARAPNEKCTATAQEAPAPISAYAQAGLAYVAFQASDLIHDSPAGSEREMIRLLGPKGAETTGVIAVWVAGMRTVLTILEAEFPDATFSAMGFSRHGKSALLAAAIDSRIDAVVAHQSGFGGAALWRSSSGEGYNRVATGEGLRDFSHWFHPDFRAKNPTDLSNMPFDQHQLLAAIAPRRVILGTGLRDTWSDPVSSWCSAQFASSAWHVPAIQANASVSMRQTRANTSPATYVRPGGHGLRLEDHLAYVGMLGGTPSNEPE
ncbi:MAG: hypothetical protein AAFY19_08460 [Pseudomonadota bacterium]